MQNLDVLPAGPIPPNPSELLASEQMSKILEDLREQYSVIIIDTPPVNIVTDTMELAKNLSGIIMVLQYGKTTREEVEEVVKRIEFSQVNLLGFILNGIKVKRSSRYYSKYAYKKGYGYYGTAASGDWKAATEQVEKEPESMAVHADQKQPKQKKGKKN